jgi:hypothetical protein
MPSNNTTAGFCHGPLDVVYFEHAEIEGPGPGAYHDRPFVVIGECLYSSNEDIKALHAIPRSSSEPRPTTRQFKHQRTVRPKAQKTMSCCHFCRVISHTMLKLAHLLERELVLDGLDSVSNPAILLALLLDNLQSVFQQPLFTPSTSYQLAIESRNLN